MQQHEHSPDEVEPPPLKRHWLHGLRCLLRFITTPSDLGNSFEAMFALAGPTIEKQFRQFSQHPTGQAMLAECPRRDLNALLLDRPTLAAMPADSFAAAYLAYLGPQEMGSAEYFLQAANLEEKATRFGWSDDQLWFIARMANSHDLFHIAADYNTDVIGEVGVICYTAGQIPLLPLKMLLLYFALLRPGQPLRWYRYLRDAYAHGRNTPALACADYEAIMALPLQEARRQLGVPAFAQAHPAGVPEKGWLLDRVERKVALV